MYLPAEQNKCICIATTEQGSTCCFECRIPPQPVPMPAALDVSATMSPADVEVSLVSPESLLPPSAMASLALSDMQSAKESDSQDGRLRDSSNQLSAHVREASLIKAGIRPSDMAGKGTENASQQVGVYQSSSALTAAHRQCMTAAGEWTVIESDGSDSEYNSEHAAKLGPVRVKSEMPREGLPQQVQGQFQAALSSFLPHSSTSTDAKLQTEKPPLLFNKKLPALNVPLTGMGRPRVASRIATPRFVAEGSGALSGSHTPKQLVLNSCSEYALIVDSYIQDQPEESQEEEAAHALQQHLSAALSWPNHIRPADSHQAASCMDACLDPDKAQRAQCGPATSGPIAEGKEAESIAAFHPSWHLRLNQTARSQTQPEQRVSSEFKDSTPLDSFYRPTAGAAKAPQHQPSIVEEAGCLNFGSHLVPSKQLPEKLPLRQKSQVRQRSAIDDAALSSDEEGSEYEGETQSQPHSPAESGADRAEDLGFTRDSGGPWDSEAEAMSGDALQGQERFEEGQYADYCSEEGLSEEGQYPEAQIDREGLDQSLDVLPAGITANTEVYSPMSHGATRVRSMITNRPFLLEEPVSPVAQQLGDTMRQGSQVTFSNQAMLDDDSTVMQNPSPNPDPGPASQEEPLYHDWTQPSASFLAAANAEAAAAAEAEAAAAEYEAQQAAVKKPLSDPNTVKAPKAGAMTRLTDSLFRRSGKRTIETQTTECREEETQTSDATDSEIQAASQQMMTATGTSCLLKGNNAFITSLVTQLLLANFMMN